MLCFLVGERKSSERGKIDLPHFLVGERKSSERGKIDLPQTPALSVLSSVVLRYRLETTSYHSQEYSASSRTSHDQLQVQQKTTRKKSLEEVKMLLQLVFDKRGISHLVY